MLMPWGVFFLGCLGFLLFLHYFHLPYVASDEAALKYWFLQTTESDAVGRGTPLVSEYSKIGCVRHDSKPGTGACTDSAPFAESATCPQTATDGGSNG